MIEPSIIICRVGCIGWRINFLLFGTLCTRNFGIINGGIDGFSRGTVLER